MNRRQVQTGKPMEQRLRYAAGNVVSGALLFTSGITARDPDGKPVGVGDMRRQTEQVVANLMDIFAAAGTDAGRIIKLLVCVTDMDAYLEAYDACAPLYVNKPSSTLLAVPRLMDPVMLIEIECVVEMPAEMPRQNEGE